MSLDMADQAQQAPQADEQASAEAALARAMELLGAGNVQAAVRAAERAVQADPDSAAAWNTLALALDEAGEVERAIEAYERTLQLDSDRPGVAERLEELREQVARVAPEHTGQAKWAAAVLAAAVAFLVLAVGLAIVVRVARQRAAEEARFQQLIDEGRAYLAAWQLDRAEAAFAEALRLRPNDRTALHWLNVVKQAREQWQQIQQWRLATAGGKFAGIRGQNPLRPAVIQVPESTAEAAQTPAPHPSTMPRTPQTARRRYTWRGSQPQWRSTQPYPSPRREPQAPIQQPAAAQPAQVAQPQGQTGQQQASQQQQVGQPSQVPEQVAATPAEAQRSTGRLVIRLHPTTGQGEAASAQQSAEQIRADAEALREQADSLSQQGRWQEAAEKYDQAISAYRQLEQADPQSREFARAAIESCQRAKQQCLQHSQ